MHKALKALASKQRYELDGKMWDVALLHCSGMRAINVPVYCFRKASQAERYVAAQYAPNWKVMRVDRIRD